MIDLFSPFNLSGLPLRNRIAMAPLTRSRSPENIPTERNALYYAQRATAGLIISEGAPISREGQGYLFNPGLYTPEQSAGWRLVTKSVHAIGGAIFAQLWHVGRVSHTSVRSDNTSPVGPSAKAAIGALVFAYNDKGEAGMVQASQPRALETAEIQRVVEDFASAAARAVEAGFDGVEVHGANSYLLEQFLNPVVNDRSDQYGGSLENRLRFPLEVVDAVIARIGKHRTAIRVSPYSQIFDMPLFDGLEQTYTAFVRALGKRGVAYVHIMDHTEVSAGEGEPSPLASRIDPLLLQFRSDLPASALIVAGNMSPVRAKALVASGTVDLIAFGRPFIANPDLVERLRHDWPLATPQPETFYGGGAEGYIDYPPHRVR